MAELMGTEYLMGEVVDLIGVEVKAQQLGVSSLVPTIVGDPGIGKSSVLKHKASQMNMDSYILSLGALPMEWFSGLPEFATEKFDPKYSANGASEVKVTEWTMSDIIRTINKKTEAAIASGKEGLIVLLDDLHLVEPTIQKYLFEFFQNKTLQNYKLHENAYLVGAMNGKGSAGLEGFLSAVLNRMAMYHAKFDKDYWYRNVGRTLHPYIASFASSSNDKYFNGANQTDSASPSPRTWTELSHLIPLLEAEAESLDVLNHALKMSAEARVGKEATVEFMKHVKLFQKFDFESILKKKDTDFKVADDISDQILTAFIIRYMNTKQDAEYIKEIIEKNINQRTFLSIILNEFSIAYKDINLLEKGPKRDAINHLSVLLTDEEQSGDELVDIVCAALMDVA